MKLTKLKIKNFRCFERLELRLHPELTVLIAPNGAGKTTLIDAARIAVWPLIKGFDLGSQTGKSATIQIEDVRLQQSNSGGMEPQIPAAIVAEGCWDEKGELVEWEQERDSIRPRTSSKGNRNTKRLTRYAADLQKRAFEAQELDLPLVAYLGTGRLWYQGRYTSKVSEKKLDRSTYSRTWGYQNCITATSSYKQFEDWYGELYRSYRELQIKNLENAPVDSEALERFKAQIAVVQNAVNTVTKQISGWHDIQYSSSHNQQLVLTHPEKGALPLSMLSDGLRNVVVMVSDIAFRCIKLNPHHGEDAAKKTSGVVMIDEVDMFLHPAWQQTIIGSLREAFPKTQLIVTTHSPQVLTTVPAECIRILGDGEVYSSPPGTKGAEASRILKRIFEVESRPPCDENTTLLLEYEKLVYEDKWMKDHAKTVRRTLDRIFAGEEPKLIELDLYIENRIWELEIEKDQ